MSAAYVGTAGIHLASMPGTKRLCGAPIRAFAPFTQFNSGGKAIGGFGPEYLMATGSHSSYNALQTSVTENASRIGLSFQASYTFPNPIDDTSSASQYLPQNPQNPAADRGPSSFDVTHSFSLSLIQLLPLDRVAFLKPLGKYVTGGWQFLNITSLSSGPPSRSTLAFSKPAPAPVERITPILWPCPIFPLAAPCVKTTSDAAQTIVRFSSYRSTAGGTGPISAASVRLGRDTFSRAGFHQYDVSFDQKYARWTQGKW